MTCLISAHLGNDIETISEVGAPIQLILLLPVIGWSYSQMWLGIKPRTLWMIVQYLTQRLSGSHNYLAKNHMSWLFPDYTSVKVCNWISGVKEMYGCAVSVTIQSSYKVTTWIEKLDGLLEMLCTRSTQVHISR